MIILKQIRDNLYGPCGYDGSGMVVGVSGGADSMLLLEMLVAIEGADKLSVLHVNHNIRGDEALRDQRHVEQYCGQRGVPFKAVWRDIPAEAESQGRSLEEAGRIARYQELEAEAALRGYRFIACAHHANDRAETVMMNILRGSGVRGLRGMDFLSGAVIRPMLNITRQQIMEYVEANGIPYVTDTTNNDNSYRRNALRNDLFKYVEDNYGVDLTDRLNSLADLAAEDSDCLDRLAETLYGQALLEDCGNHVILDMAVLSGQEPALVKRVIRRAILQAKGDLVDVTHSHVQAVQEICNRTGKRVHLPQGIEAVVSYGKLSIGHCSQQEKPLHTPTISWQIVPYVPEDKAKYRQMNKAPGSGESLTVMCFDADKVLNLGEPQIRHRATGDRVHLDKVGSKRLKDWMIDNKVPLDDRDNLWLVACGNRVLALPQYRVFGGLEPGDNTQKVLILRID